MRFRFYMLLSLLLLGGAWPAMTMAQGTDANEPVAVVGTFSSESYAINEDKFGDASATLLDASNLITGDTREWLPVDGQILGYWTSPVFPLPSQYRINLPVVPSGSSHDLDNDGETDAGVQVFFVTVAANLIGDSYLQQMEQLGGLWSVLTDPISGRIVEGDLVIYSPDDKQAFPSGAGADGLWFTADDDTVGVAQGYTKVTLAADGSSTFFRTPELTIDTRERVESASPDFSDLGILESYQALIDHLKMRYAYTELRGLDWEAIRTQYLPEVEAADAANDLDAFFTVLRQLALSIGDSHVTAVAGTGITPSGDTMADYSASVGAWLIQVQHPATAADGRDGAFVILSVGADSPAAEAGWVPGTEIVSIDGISPEERLAQIPADEALGTEAGRRLHLTPAILGFREGQETTIEYKLPGSDEVQSATLVAGQYDVGLTTFGVTLPGPFPINIRQEGEYTVLRWGDFSDSVATKIAVLEEALQVHQGMETGGMILDLRGNGGGWAELYQVMVSYFYTEEDPLPFTFFDFWPFDSEAGTWVRPAATDYQLIAPVPDLAYTGPLVILVDEKCESACEYFSQTLQKTGRGIVIGQHATAGAGGYIDIITMPGETRFVYTAGRTTFAGTEDFNLEAKGVTPDVWVPVTVETELAKEAGGDPVMEVAIAELDRINAEIAATPVADT